MAEISFDGRKTVKGLKKDFMDAFGVTLRVYTTVNCKQPAKDNDTVASLRTKDSAGGPITVGGNLQVGSLQERVAKNFGIGVLIADKKNKTLAPKDITLVAAGKL